MARPRIVIVGGGFAGVKCAKVLARARAGLDLVMFNPANYMVFTPLLADVARLTNCSRTCSKRCR